MIKQVGIVFTQNSEGQLVINTNYINWIEKSGWQPVIINPFDREVRNIDLLILPGGSDVDPVRYGRPWGLDVGLPNRSLEFFDQVVLPKYIGRRIPIFGICRGLQTLNVLFGGTLKNVDDEPQSYHPGDPVHHISLSGYKELHPVSSNHHQAIDVLASDFVEIARGFIAKGKKDEVKYIPLHIEGIRHKTLPIAAVQFHPEKNNEGETCEVANEFVHNLITQICA